MNIAMLSCMMAATRKHDQRPPASAESSVAEFLREVMVTYGCKTVADLVRLVDVDQSSMSRYLSGQTTEPSLTNLRKIAHGLGTDLGTVMVAAGLATDEALGRVAQRRFSKVLVEVQDEDDVLPDAEGQVLMLLMRDAYNMWKRVRNTQPVPVDIVDRGRVRRGR